MILRFTHVYVVAITITRRTRLVCDWVYADDATQLERRYEFHCHHLASASF